MKKVFILLAFATIFATTTPAFAVEVNDFNDLNTKISNDTTTSISVTENLTGSYTYLGDPTISKTLESSSGRKFTISSNYCGSIIENAITLTVNNLSFNGFNASFGDYRSGGVFNVKNGGTLNLNNVTFTSNYANESGGAINNDGTVKIDGTVNFEGNETGSGSSGAIYNGGTLTLATTSATFKSNTASSSGSGGGAIYNTNNLKITGGTTDFIGNASSSKGGAISNTGTIDISGTTTFDGNSGNTDGGAVYNELGTINFKGVTTFKNNTLKEGNGSGGAVHNFTKGEISFNDKTTFENNILTTDGDGGAISNWSKMTFDGDATFKGNSVKLDGGAILNKNGTLSFGEGNIEFIGNSSTNGNGGAIYNCSDTNSFVGINGTSTFNGNTAGVNGGAIYNDKKMTFNGTTSFINNTAGVNGGAIYNSNELNLVGNTSFKDNYAKDVLNDISNEGTLNVHNSITLHGGINSPNKQGATNFKSGSIIKIADGYNGVTNIQQKSITFGENNVTNQTFTVDMRNNAINTLAFETTGLLRYNGICNLFLDADLANKKIDTIGMGIDKVISLQDGKFNIQGINLISDSIEEEVTTNKISDRDSFFNRVTYTGASEIDGFSPVYKYKYSVKYNNDSTSPNYGTFTFVRSGGGTDPSGDGTNPSGDGTNPSGDGTDPTIGGGSSSGGSGGSAESFNPAVLASPIAANVGSYTNALTSYENGFKGLDNFMNMTSAERFALKNRNVYAINDTANIKYDDNGNKGLWFNPYATFENVKLNNGPNVTSVSYGSFIGGDSEIISLKKGWDAIYSLYTGYTGSHQSYDSTSVYQNGGVLGTSATFYKGNYFLGSTINVGASNAQASTMYGNEDFTTFNSGVAVKTGYNFEVKEGLFILQPSMLMSYTFVKTFDYTNAAGVDISSTPMHAINLAPGLKFIWNLKNGWQPYLNTRMVWNLMDKSSFTATYAGQSTPLPQTSIDPYFQYGLGVKKTWGERLTGFAQTMLNGGGRNGVALQFGFKIKLGKESV